jgi:glycosyltransferase involved in cell wall biosynthesis
MTTALAQLSTVSNYDLFHVAGIHMYRYVEPFIRASHPPPRVVYNWHNIESEAMHRYAATINSRARRLYARQTAAKIEALERTILKTAYGHIVCSERERSQLGCIAPTARIDVVENGVDTAYFAGDDHGGSTPKRIVFVGLMDYYPNVEGAVSFGNRIWPRLRERLPGVIFTIVGANPTPAVLSLRAIAGIEVTGTVPDVRPYYRDALAAIVPLRTGGGTRLKALEAMAAGVPVISTQLGVEGLAVAPGQDILIADPDNHETWLRHLTHLVDFPERRQQITTAAMELVCARYDWEIIGEKLSQTCEEWLREV